MNLTKRSILSIIIVILLIPVMILLSKTDGIRYYYLAGTGLVLIAMIPFFIRFEGKAVRAQEMVILAVLCALAIASRTVFAFIPHFKPLAAFVIIAGIEFGPEAGFIVGSVSMFASDFIFGQGTWTPWQMFAFGIGGLLAGLLQKAGILKKNRIAMAVFGFLMIFVIVGPLLDTSTVLMAAYESKEEILAVYLAGVPVNLIHGAAVGLTMLLIGKPMFEKLDRIVTKYGL